jgi:NADP-dependent 3-hydroxy acid dehydrogenase YdfG
MAAGPQHCPAELRTPASHSRGAGYHLTRIHKVTSKLAGKVVIITGASAGIGRASARSLAREGAKLVLTARRQDRLDELIEEVRSLGGDGVAVIGDAREELTALKTVEAAKKLGGIDILINNVGIGNYKKLVDTSLSDYVEMMDANVRTSFLFTRHVVPTMIAQGDGLILMVSSMAGVYGFPGEAVYCATKFAQVGFAQGLDKELRSHGIKVGTINPGGVKTEFALGKGRTESSVEQSDMLEPEDVAAAIHFACTQPKGSRIIQVQMRTMAEALT